MQTWFACKTYLRYKRNAFNLLVAFAFYMRSTLTEYYFIAVCPMRHNRQAVKKMYMQSQSWWWISFPRAEMIHFSHDTVPLKWRTSWHCLFKVTNLWGSPGHAWTASPWIPSDPSSSRSILYTQLNSTPHTRNLLAGVNSREKIVLKITLT